MSQIVQPFSLNHLRSLLNGMYQTVYSHEDSYEGPLTFQVFLTEDIELWIRSPKVGVYPRSWRELHGVQLVWLRRLGASEDHLDILPFPDAPRGDQGRAA